MRLLLSTGLGAVLMVSAMAAAGLLGDGRGGDPDTERIAGLVRQLGDRKFATRESASEALAAAGEKALPALHDAMASKDLEVQRRAQKAARTILEGLRKSASTGLELAVVEAGAFAMGSPKEESGRRADEPEHRVRITRPFLLGAYEVTQDEYRRVMKANPSGFQGAGGDTGRNPVENVTWYDAVAFCNRLSEQDGYAPYYRMTDVRREGGSIKGARVELAGGNGYRLPTEAEWEYACRAATTTLFHFGDATKSGLLNCKPLKVAGGYGTTLKWPDLGRTARIGSYPPNGLGLYDMHGNVAEWCGDWYDKDYYEHSPRDDPRGPEHGTHRVLRGGSWMVPEGSCRSASRFFQPPDEGKDYAGFRVARTPGK